MADNSYRDAEGNLDVPAVLAAIQKGSQEAQLVAAQRPTAEELAATLIQVVDLLERWVLLYSNVGLAEDGIDPDSQWRWGVMGSSAARQAVRDAEVFVRGFVGAQKLTDTMWLDTNPERNPWDWGLGFLRRSHYTITDNLRGIAAVLAEESTSRSAVTLARSVMEASARTVFVLDASIDEAERLRRVLNLRLEECKESSNGQHADGGNVEEENAISELLGFAQHAGYALKRAYKPDRHWPAVLAAKDGRQSDFSTAQIIDTVLPGIGRDMWRSMSAVAHSRKAPLFMLGDLVPPERVKEWQRTQSIAWHTLAALLAAREAYNLLGEFTGWGSDGWVELIDALALQWSVAAGIHDKQIRRTLGLDS